MATLPNERKFPWSSARRLRRTLYEGFLRIKVWFPWFPRVGARNVRPAPPKVLNLLVYVSISLLSVGLRFALRFALRLPRFTSRGPASGSRLCRKCRSRRPGPMRRTARESIAEGQTELPVVSARISVTPLIPSGINEGAIICQGRRSRAPLKVGALTMDKILSEGFGPINLLR